MLVELYSWPMMARAIITPMLALCVLAQTASLVLSRYRHPRNRERIFENLLEFSILLNIIVLSLMHGQVLHGFDIGQIAPTGYVVLRWVSFAANAILACIVIMHIKKAWPLLIIAASGLTLPAMEGIAGGAFMWVYLTVLGFWLMRAIHICMLRYRELRTSISALSIKNAVDSLHSGVLFSEADGSILLVNARMQQLMVAISGGVCRDGNHFYDLLISGGLQPGCRTTEYDGQYVCLLPDETAWLFTRTELHTGQSYIQLTAADITQRWALTAQLQQQENLLQRRAVELGETIANLHVLSRERETQKARMRAHDILGHRLSLLLQTIRNHQAMDLDLLRSLSRGLLDELKTSQSPPAAEEEFVSLQQAFASIGVAVNLDGALPQSAVGRLFVDIIREGVTNAVRHGFATEISVNADSTGEGHRLQISNNGHPPAPPIVEGGGIGGMRSKVEPNGGTLEVAACPRFTLTVYMPGGEDDG